MSRPIFRWAAIVQIGLVLLSGCHPTQPFFVPRDDSLAHYIAQSLDIEYADAHVESLPEATQAMIPLGPDNIPTEFVDLSLEDCISIAIQNSKILRVNRGTTRVSGPVSAAILSAQPGQLPSIYDPAVVATTTSTQPLTVDSQGNRIAPRGSIRANQVGGVEDALSEFDAQFSALFGYNTTDRARNVTDGNVFNPQQFQAVDANGQAAISKRLATGTIATARVTNVYSHNNIFLANGNRPGVGRAVPSDYTTAIELQATQPLLRGRGTLVNRIPIVLARINEDLELHTYEANVRNLVRDVEHAYWDLYLGYRSLETAKRAQASALDLWRVAKARTEVTDGPPEAEAQARALYYQFGAQVHTTLYGSSVAGNDPLGLYGREQALRERMGWSATDGRLIRPADEPTVARLQFDWEDVRAESLTRNVELRQQKWAIKQREMELISAKNQVLPQLDVTAFYRWLGVGDYLATSNPNGIRFPNSSSSAIEELLTGDYQEVGARLEFTPQPFGKRRALASIQNAHIQLVKNQEELREKEMALLQELSFAWRNLDSTYVSIKDYLEQWQANEDEIRVFTDRIDVGAVDDLFRVTDNLLRAEERRARAQFQYYSAVAEYNKSIVNIHYLKGSLLDLNNIALEEGPWVDKAYWDAEELARERASGIYFDYGYTRPSVISQGPVETGGLTEGNITRPGSNYNATTEGQAEEVPAEEAIDPDSPEDDGDPRRLPPLPQRDPPTASTNQPRSLGEAGNAVRRASANQFDWGAMGLGDEGDGGQVPETTSNANPSIYRGSVAGRPVAVISSGGQSSSTNAAPKWHPR